MEALHALAEHAARVDAALLDALDEVLGLSDAPLVPPSAPCRQPGADPENWFDLTGGVTFAPGTDIDAWRAQRAAALCAGCPVLQQCRDWALRCEDLHGVYGGTTPEQRYAVLVAAGRMPYYAAAA